MLTEKIAKAFVTFLIILTLSLLILIPVIVAIDAFSPTAYSNFPPSSLSFRWFENFFGNPSLLSSFQISIFFAAIVAVATVTIGTLASYVIARYQFKGKKLIDALIQAPIVFPGVALGNALLVFFYSSGFYYHLAILIIGQTIIGLPYVFRVMLPSFTGLNQSFEEASMTLGASRVETFFRVTLPLVKSALLAGAILGFAAAFNDYAVSVFLVDPTIQTLPVQLMGLMQAGVDPTIAAAATFTVLIMIVLLVVCEKIVGIDKLMTGVKY